MEDLEAVFQHRVPHQDVTVQTRQPQLALAAPVVVVGARTSAFAVERAPPIPMREDRSQLFGDGALASLGIEVRVAGQQLFTVQELDIRRQEGVRSCSAQTRARWP